MISNSFFIFFFFQFYFFIQIKKMIKANYKRNNIILNRNNDSNQISLKPINTFSLKPISLISFAGTVATDVKIATTISVIVIHDIEARDNEKFLNTLFIESLILLEKILNAFIYTSPLHNL